MLTGSVRDFYSGEGAMPQASRIAWVTAAVVLACAGCSPSDDPPSSSHSPPSQSSSPVESSPSASAAIPPYLAKYTPRQRKAYAAAVADRERFSERQSAIYARGKATRQARTFYQKYTASWQSYWARLRQFDQQRIRVVGRSEVIRVRPAEIRLDSQGGSISLEVCGDGDNVKVFQDGALTEQPQRAASSVKVAMVKLEGESWWRVLYERPVEQKC